MNEDKNFYFENTKGNHSKFWAVTIETDPKSNDHYLLIRRWGKTGENGRVMSERFYNYYEAESKRTKLIQEKKLKGYSTIL